MGAVSRLVRVAQIGEIPVGRGKSLEVEGVTLAVYNVGSGEYRVMSAVPARGGPLGTAPSSVTASCARGTASTSTSERRVRCRPDLSVAVFPVRVTDSDVLVELP
jgi:hypothetical protein